MSKINRYDQPARAEFINTYVPIPFDQMMKVGLMKQQLVEEDDKTANETLASLSNFQVAPFDEKKYLDIRRNYETKLNDLYSNSGGPGNYDFKRGVAKLRTEMAMDPVLRGMQYNLGQYQEFQTRKEEALKNQATEANKRELFNSYKDISEAGGTAGLLEKTGSAKWTPGSWYKNVDTREEAKKYVDDVVKSSTQFAGAIKDSTGKLVLDRTDGGRSLNALYAPFGITFKEITKNGKKEMVMDMDKANLENMLATPMAEQWKRNADIQVDAPRGSDEWNKKFYENMMSDINSTVNEFVSKDSSLKWSADPFALANYKNSLKTKNPAFTRPIIVGAQGSTINSFDKFTEAVDGFSANEVEITSRYREYLDKQGVKYDSVRGEDGRIVIKPLDHKGDDVAETISQYQAELDQEWQKRNDLKKKYNDIIRDIGVKEGWDDNIASIEKTVILESAREAARKTAERKLRSENMQTKQFGYSTGLASGDFNMNDLTPSGVDRFEELYKEELLKRSSVKKSIDKAFKENAEAEAIEIGVTPFNDTKFNEVASKDFRKFVTEGGTGKRLLGGTTGARWVGTKDEFSADDYKKLSSDKDAEFLGVSYDPEFGYPMYIYRPYDKDGKLLPPVMIEAPQGVESKLIEDGFITFNQAKMHRDLVNLENNESHTAKVGEGDYQGEVRRLTKTRKRYSPVSDIYELTLTGIDPDTKTRRPKIYTFSSRQELIDFYTNFVEANTATK